MKNIVISENKLRTLVTESVKNILNEGLYEFFSEKNNSQTSSKGKKKSGLAAQAKQKLGDDKLDNAEVARQLEDGGFLSGDEDTDRSWISKIKRGQRPMPPGVAAAIMNITSNG